jgi:hypothetical protein
VKGKFSNETAERLYEEWNDGRHTGDCYDGSRWYVLFIDMDGGDGHILTECEQGFVDVLTYSDEQIMEAWHIIAAECEKWNEDMVPCARCSSVYDETAGDGYCGLCPRCADQTEREMV